MTTRSDFDSEDDVRRNNNILRIENGAAPRMVLVRILDKNGDVENESEVDGAELIRAVRSAMDCP